MTYDDVPSSFLGSDAGVDDEYGNDIPKASIAVATEKENV